MPDLVKNPEDMFSHDTAPLKQGNAIVSATQIMSPFGFSVTEDSDQPGHQSSLISLHCMHDEG